MGDCCILMWPSLCDTSPLSEEFCHKRLIAPGWTRVLQAIGVDYVMVFLMWHVLLNDFARSYSSNRALVSAERC